MKAKELIHTLEKMVEQYGDKEVELKCCDEGGYYLGSVPVTIVKIPTEEDGVGADPDMFLLKGF